MLDPAPRTDEFGIHGWSGVSSTVGLDAGRGTTPVTGVASAFGPWKIGAFGATASITDLCISWSKQISFSHAASLAEATCEV